MKLSRGRSWVLLCVVAVAVAHAEVEDVFYDAFDVATEKLSGGIVQLERPSSIELGGVIAANVVPMLVSGDAANRIDIVFVGDGYLASELDEYAGHATTGMAALLAETPFQQYSDFFNFYRVEVISNESGVDNDPSQGIDRDTAMNMRYWCNGIERLLCVDVGLAYSYANNAPGVDQIFAIANSTKYGGAGYSSSELATYAGGNGAAPEIAIHEIGHSLGNLADEYFYDGDTYNGPETNRVNTSILTEAEMANAQTKWWRWLGTNNPQLDGLQSTFEGAGYYDFGLYRPSNNSKMRSLGRPFNHISVEALIVEIYKIVRPIDDATPNDQPLSGDEFVELTLVQPNGQPLDVSWYLEDVLIAGETGTTLDLAALELADGSYTLSAKVVDNTPWVRDPALRDLWLTQWRDWDVVVSGCTPSGDMNCDGVTTVSDIGGFVLALTDPSGYGDLFPDCDINAADMNCDSFVTVSDIGLFVETLTGGS